MDEADLANIVNRGATRLDIALQPAGSGDASGSCIKMTSADDTNDISSSRHAATRSCLLAILMSSFIAWCYV